LKNKFIKGPEHILKKEFQQSDLQCNEEIINLIINQLDTTSAPGVDVFSPHMMVEMWNARNYFPDLTDNIIKLFNLIINGRLPKEITKTVFACRLIPVIKKKDEFNNITDIRPICVPTTWCRIVQNIVMNLNLKQIKNVIHPGQIALGIANG